LSSAVATSPNRWPRRSASRGTCGRRRIRHQVQCSDDRFETVRGKLSPAPSRGTRSARAGLHELSSRIDVAYAARLPVHEPRAHLGQFALFRIGEVVVQVFPTIRLRIESPVFEAFVRRGSGWCCCNEERCINVHEQVGIADAVVKDASNSRFFGENAGARIIAGGG